MNVGEAIQQRRSVANFTPQVPDRAIIEQILAAGTRAPVHFLTAAGRFCVVAGAARAELGRLMADRLRERKGNPGTPEVAAAAQAEAVKPTRAPVLIAVGVEKIEHPKAKWLEEVAAGAAAAENMLLMAAELGLGAAWRTGTYDDPVIKGFFGLKPEDHLVAVLLLGYPEGTGDPRPRAPFAEKTTWKGWD